nr:hypothetical protein [Bacteroidales bacterium]
IFESPELYEGGTLAIAGLLFAVQIYADFSGYSEIAIGTARLFGFRLMTNFKYPYFFVVDYRILETLAYFINKLV